MAGSDEKRCPKCEDDLFCGVNRVEDPGNMTDLEKKHVPVITASTKPRKGECFEVTVEVGKLLEHPNTPAHFINFVELYADDTYLGRTHFTHTRTCPVAKFCVALSHIHKKLRAFAWCNLHGTWEGDLEMEVSE